MRRKSKIGMTRDFFDGEGKLILPGSVLERLNEMSHVEYEVLPELLPEITPEQIRNFDIVVSRSPKWTQQSLTGNNRLLSILRNGVGYEMIDVPAMTNAGVMLCNTPAAVRRPVAVGIMTFLLTLSTRILTKDKLTREGRWDERGNYHGDRLTGKTCGAIGVGNIGHEMFLLAKPFGMKHIAYDPYVIQEAVADVNVDLVDLNTVLAESDFLIIVCPLTEKTHHLIGEKELRKMKKTAFLINVARGCIVDETALIEALQKGYIRGAGLDVFEQEPIKSDNPLLNMENVIVTPHALAFTDEFFATMWDQIVNQISQIISGQEPEALVNREVLETPAFQSKIKK